uniref:Small acidic protein n=1 Tax=Steinernema glaseri TaxID=37863 RepID=A0A1I7ZW84_9BILA
MSDERLLRANNRLAGKQLGKWRRLKGRPPELEDEDGGDQPGTAHGSMCAAVGTEEEEARSTKMENKTQQAPRYTQGGKKGGANFLRGSELAKQVKRKMAMEQRTGQGSLVSHPKQGNKNTFEVPKTSRENETHESEVFVWN